MTDGQAPPLLGQAPVLVHIDHVGIHADDPAARFRFFAKDLGLPVAFPYTTCPAYSRGTAPRRSLPVVVEVLPNPCLVTGDHVEHDASVLAWRD
jgi:hypothetical protein